MPPNFEHFTQKILTVSTSPENLSALSLADPEILIREYRVIMAVTTVLEIFEVRSPKPMADFLLEFFTRCRGSYPLTNGEVLNFSESEISGNVGLNFEYSNPSKNSGSRRGGGWGSSDRDPKA